jgi:hypothetical protein
VHESLVTVTRFYWLMSADLARCRLASAGIEVFLPDEFSISLRWHYANALGGIRLQVSSADLEDARAILEEPPQEIAEPTLTGAEKKAERALLVAVCGFFLAPLVIYALWLLGDLFASSERLSPKAHRDVVAAAVLTFLLSALIVIYAVFRFLDIK